MPLVLHRTHGDTALIFFSWVKSFWCGSLTKYITLSIIPTNLRSRKKKRIIPFPIACLNYSSPPLHGSNSLFISRLSRSEKTSYDAIGRGHLLAFLVYAFYSDHFLLSPHKFGIRSIWNYYVTEWQKVSASMSWAGLACCARRRDCSGKDVIGSGSGLGEIPMSGVATGCLFLTSDQ
jgi:hypothetical protein